MPREKARSSVRPRRRLHMRRVRLGAAPGSLHPPVEQRMEEVAIELFAYGGGSVEEKKLGRVEEAFDYLGRAQVTWVNIAGLHDVTVLEKLGERLGLHPLTLEDVLNTGQRPKLEEHEGHLFIVLRQIHFESEHVDSEQISLFVGPGWVITLQEVPGDVFDPVRERIRKGGKRLHAFGADYLAYALVDALVDQVFPVLEKLGERIEELEDELVDSPTRATLGRIHAVKKDLLALRRATWPQREVINAFERQEPPLVADETKIFLRDVYDHAIQVLDIIETYRDLAGSMIDIYLSSLSNRMNEVMKVLTVMASIFIPLTFLAGVYGMNFDRASPYNMPELGWRYGYPAFWVVIVVIFVGMVVYFKRKDWL